MNGVLLPGGGSPLDEGPYAETVDIIIESSKKFYDNGKYFPIWGTCLSFEKIIVHFLNGSLKWESQCHVQNLSLNLELEDSVINDPKSTRMFRDMDSMMPNLFHVSLIDFFIYFQTIFKSFDLLHRFYNKRMLLPIIIVSVWH